MLLLYGTVLFQQILSAVAFPIFKVGLNEIEARETGIEYEVVKYGMDDLDRAIADSEDHGFVKVLTVPGKDKILGVTIVGNHAALA